MAASLAENFEFPSGGVPSDPRVLEMTYCLSPSCSLCFSGYGGAAEGSHYVRCVGLRGAQHRAGCVGAQDVCAGLGPGAPVSASERPTLTRPPKQLPGYGLLGSTLQLMDDF